MQEDHINHFYLKQEEPLKSALIALHAIILTADTGIKPAWKYGSPFFVYKGKNLCYLWYNKQTLHPYIGIIDGQQIDHPALSQGNRKQIKILSLNPAEDFPIESIQTILSAAIEHCAERAKKR